MDKDNFLGFIITDSNRFVVSAITEKVSAIATKDYLQPREQRADKQAFQRLLAKIGTVGL